MQAIAELIDSMKASISIFEAFTESLPAQVLDRRRRPGSWTLAEHISHLAQVQPMLLERLQRFTQEERPRFVPYIPGEDEETSDTPERMEIDEAVAQFSDVRKKQIALIEGADRNIWQKSADHPEYELYGFYILVRHLLMHDHWHMYRMEELWLTRDEYFTDLT